jgi:bacillopeptidase F (M6 metalloprotease family)
MMDGDDFAGTLAYSGTYEWYSDAEDFAWRSFYQTFNIPGTGATLNFETFYEMENNWDYGYVEVFDQNTGEWYTLDATGNVSTLPNPQDNPNTPIDREPSNYEAAGRWHAFTGSSGGWVPVTMDLTPFAGHTIDIYFTTWQDVTISLEMMYIDDISIPEIGFSDDIEAGEDGWSTTGWYVTDGIQENGFGVMVMDTRGVPTERYPEPAGNKAMRLHHVKVMEVDSNTQSGVLGIQETPLDSKRTQVVITTSHASHNLPSHYELLIE